MTQELLAIDLSTKPGWAYFSSGKLVAYNTIFADKKAKDFGTYPENFVKWADYTIERLMAVVVVHSDLPGLEVVVEETSTSRACYSQKILEFCHYKLVTELMARKIPVKYVRTGVWRKIVGATQLAEEKRHNARVGRIKKTSGKRLAKIDGKVTRKFDRKDYGLRAFETHFGTKLDRKMEDAAEAALLGLAYLRGVNVCDGTVTGGLWDSSTAFAA